MYPEIHLTLRQIRRLVGHADSFLFDGSPGERKHEINHWRSQFDRIRAVLIEDRKKLSGDYRETFSRHRNAEIASDVSPQVDVSLSRRTLWLEIAALCAVLAECVFAAWVSVKSFNLTTTQGVFTGISIAILLTALFTGVLTVLFVRNRLPADSFARLRGAVGICGLFIVGGLLLALWGRSAAAVATLTGNTAFLTSAEGQAAQEKFMYGLVIMSVVLPVMSAALHSTALLSDQYNRIARLYNKADESLVSVESFLEKIEAKQQLDDSRVPPVPCVPLTATALPYGVSKESEVATHANLAPPVRGLEDSEKRIQKIKDGRSGNSHSQEETAPTPVPTGSSDGGSDSPAPSTVN